MRYIMEKILINEMSWSEFAEKMKTNELIIIPVGVTEEHGKHNPLGTDTYIAEEAAYRIGERTGYPVAPCMRYGYSPSVANFPGTITIDPNLFKKIMVSYAESFIKHGAKRFLFVNGHGGNDATLDAVCADLFDHHGAVCSHSEWWLQLPSINEKWKKLGHGDLYETSMVMTAKPEAVNLEYAENGPSNPFIPGMENGRYKGMRLGLSQDIWKVNRIGNMGEHPKDSNVELGEEMMADYVDFCVDLAHELMKVDLNDVLVTTEAK